MPNPCIFPPIFNKEKLAAYVKRCINMNTVAARFPNRKERKKELIAYYKSTNVVERHAWFNRERLLFFKDAAKYLGISESALSMWGQRGFIKPSYIKHKKRRYRVYEKKVLDQIKELRDEIKSTKQESNSD